jgi:hypothetical protein
MLYRVFDVVVDSEIPLLDFEPVSSGVPALSVKLRQSAFDTPDGLVWSDVFSDTWSAARGTTTRPNPIWRVAWDGEDLLVAISKCGEFRLEDGFRTLICRAYSKTSDWALRSQLSYNVVPRILSERGHLIVHASCVSIDGGSVLFMGSSGAGKSTLAASFVGNGGDLVSDDCVLLRTEEGRLMAHVTGGNARLWDDSLNHLAGEHHNASVIARKPAASKWSHRTGQDKVLPTSTRVDAIFYLPVDDSVAACADVTISEAGGPQLLALLTRGTLLLAPGVKRNKSKRFVVASDVTNACPAFYSLRYPRAFDRLPEVRRAVVGKALESRHVSVAR